MTTFLIFVILLFLSGFFSSAETAFFSLTHAQVRTMTKKKKKCAQLVFRLKEDPQRLLATILIGNNIVNILTASYATVVATRYFDSGALGIATGITTIFILIFGEIVPKTIAYGKNTSVACFAAWPIYFCNIILFPIVWVLNLLNNWLQEKFHISHEKRVTEEEVRTVARLGVEHGGIDYREHEMIENIFRFDDVDVGDVMTPLYRVTLINGNVPVEQIAYFIANEVHSRFPVYDGDEDNIIGYIHIKDVMRALNSDKRDQLVKNFILPVRRVKESIHVERIFRSMKRRHSHLYLVTRDNKESDVIGIITLEDIVEEIVGEIEDETDLE